MYERRQPDTNEILCAAAHMNCNAKLEHFVSSPTPNRSNVKQRRVQLSCYAVGCEADRYVYLHCYESDPTIAVILNPEE